MERYEEINSFWLGNIENTIVPSEHRAQIWFGDDVAVDETIRSDYYEDFRQVVAGECKHWLESPRGRLAQIIMLDQFSRHIYRGLPTAFAQDELACTLCLEGAEAEIEHNLSLIERIFFYFPLMHSEMLYHQEKSLIAYQMLAELAFTETRVIYDSFFKFANHHYQVIQRFGRFPQRNNILGRESTAEELHYLDEIQSQ